MGGLLKLSMGVCDMHEDGVWAEPGSGPELGSDPSLPAPGGPLHRAVQTEAQRTFWNLRAAASWQGPRSDFISRQPWLVPITAVSCFPEPRKRRPGSPALGLGPRAERGQGQPQGVGVPSSPETLEAQEGRDSDPGSLCRGRGRRWGTWAHRPVPFLMSERLIQPVGWEDAWRRKGSPMD